MSELLFSSVVPTSSPVTCTVVFKVCILTIQISFGPLFPLFYVNDILKRMYKTTFTWIICFSPFSCFVILFTGNVSCTFKMVVSGLKIDVLLLCYITVQFLLGECRQTFWVWRSHWWGSYVWNSATDVSYYLQLPSFKSLSEHEVYYVWRNSLEKLNSHHLVMTGISYKCSHVWN
jgi:hypothetical protein